ncbi:IS481 family transposase [Microcella frigidaquae]
MSVEGRRLLCRRVRELNWKVADAAFAGGISERRAYEWLARFDAGETLADRSSRPKSSPKKTPASVEAAIVRLRTLRKTASTIAAILQMAVSTVCAVLARVGLNRLSKLEPVEPANRYCRRHAGELIHLDIKTLGRFRRPGKRALGQGADRRSRKAGWEAVHVAVDDATRLSYVEVLPDQTAATTVGFLHRAIAWFARHGVIVQEVMTDNGSAYVSRLWAATCAEVGLVHIRTRPYRPRTNGKAERFIQTLLREWAYAATYRDSDHRRAVLPEWVRYYNTQRPHGSLGHKAPMTVLAAA